MNQLPTVLQLFPCLVAGFDLKPDAWLKIEAGWVIAGPIHTLERPVLADARMTFFEEQLSVYVQLVNGIGTCNLSLELRASNSKAVVGKTPSRPVRFPPGKWWVYEDVFVLQNVPFRGNGSSEYEFQLLHNHREFGPAVPLVVM